MPKIRRWFHVSHDINADPEVWALRRENGEKSLSIWLEILSIADRNESVLPGDYEQLIRSIAGRCQATTRTVSAVFDFAKSRLWLVSDPSLRVRNWSEYNKTRESHKIPRGNSVGSPPNLPNLPNLPTTPNGVVEKAPSCAATQEATADFSEADPRSDTLALLPANVTPLPVVVARDKPWPDEDQWLLNFLRTQTVLPQLSAVPASESKLLDYGWWENVSQSINGLDLDFLQREFAKIGAYLTEKPRKRPTPKGWRTFLRAWLDRSHEYERRRA